MKSCGCWSIWASTSTYTVPQSHTVVIRSRGGRGSRRGGVWLFQLLSRQLRSWNENVTAHAVMAFLKKKRVKFVVDLEVHRLTDVTLLNATLFAKVRLIDGGSFEGFTNHGQVEAHTVYLGPKFNFEVRIPADTQTGELEPCRCKVSIRKEDRGGRTTTKLGFVIVNLSEFAASGVNEIQKNYLLDGYTGQRQDNSRVHIHVRMIHQGADPMFKVPNMLMSSSEEAQLNPIDRKGPSQSQVEDDRLITSQSNELPSPTSLGPFERSSLHGHPQTGHQDTVSLSSSSNATGPAGSLATTPQPPTPSLTAAMRRVSEERISTTINRVQQTRRDAQDVIDEVIAETSALHTPRNRASTSYDYEADDPTDGKLELYVDADGEAVVGLNGRGASLQKVGLDTGSDFSSMPSAHG